jgi:hypothetical protein
MASFQTERTLYESPLGLALLYDGWENNLGSGHCTITERRIILQTNRGGYQQILLRDISNLTPKIGWLRHSVIISEGGYAHFVLSGKNKNETEEIFFRVKEALMSQTLERILQ